MVVLDSSQPLIFLTWESLDHWSVAFRAVKAPVARGPELSGGHTRVTSVPWSSPGGVPRGPPKCSCAAWNIRSHLHNGLRSPCFLHGAFWGVLCFTKWPSEHIWEGTIAKESHQTLKKAEWLMVVWNLVKMKRELPMMTWIIKTWKICFLPATEKRERDDETTQLLLVTVIILFLAGPGESWLRSPECPPPHHLSLSSISFCEPARP